MPGAVLDLVGNRCRPRAVQLISAGTEVPGEPGVSAAGDLQPNAVPGCEDVRDIRERDAQPPDLARRSIGRRAPDDLVGEVAGPAAGVHVAQPDEHIAVRVVRAQVQLDNRRTGHLHLLRELAGAEGQHVGARLDRRVIAAAGVAH
jgi:hypothetical protein